MGRFRDWNRIQRLFFVCRTCFCRCFRTAPHYGWHLHIRSERWRLRGVWRSRRDWSRGDVPVNLRLWVGLVSRAVSLKTETDVQTSSHSPEKCTHLPLEPLCHTPTLFVYKKSWKSEGRLHHWDLLPFLLPCFPVLLLLSGQSQVLHLRRLVVSQQTYSALLHGASHLPTPDSIFNSALSRVILLGWACLSAADQLVVVSLGSVSRVCFTPDVQQKLDGPQSENETQQKWVCCWL